MEYIVHRRLKERAICGVVNIPAQTKCEEHGGMIYLDGSLLCAARSENAHQYFARNDDGCGMERGQLTQSIQKCLAAHDRKHQERWDRVWDDAVCLPYRRTEQPDYWLWNHDFFNAPIEDLRHIAALVGE